MWTEKFQMYKQDLEKAEEPETKLPISAGSWKKQENCKKCQIYFCFIDYTKAFDCVVHNKLWIILKEMGILTILPFSWKTCMQVKKHQLELDMELVQSWERSNSRLYTVTLLN